METLQALTESYWLRTQALATVLYALLTFRCLKTRKNNRFSLIGGMWLLMLIALIAPFAALGHSGFWSSVLASAVLWVALFWYEGQLVTVLMRNNPGAIAYMIPLMVWLFSLPLAGLFHFLMT